TSGSHERYKSQERMRFEEDYDCLKRMREWMVAEGVADAKTLDAVEAPAAKEAEQARQEAWDEFNAPISKGRAEVVAILRNLANESEDSQSVAAMADGLEKNPALLRRTTMSTARRALLHLADQELPAKRELKSWIDRN